MNNWILGVALTGAALLAPSAQADGMNGLGHQCEAANVLSPAQVDGVIAEITSTIERTMIDPRTVGLTTIEADMLSTAAFPIYDDTYVPEQHWSAAVLEIPVAHWETAVYEIPLTIELAVGADPYVPAGFAVAPMAVDLTSSDGYVTVEPVLMMEVRVRY